MVSSLQKQSNTTDDRQANVLSKLLSLVYQVLYIA